MAAALRDLPGVSETASLAGPYDVIARAQARDIDELAKLVALRVQALDGVTRTEPPKDGLGEREMLEAWVFGRPGARWPASSAAAGHEAPAGALWSAVLSRYPLT